jgi:hypothetical protein
MDSIETLGSTEFAMRNAMLRIDAISEAKTAHEAILFFGAATAYITASAELKAITESSWANLLDLADAAYNTHPLATGTSDNFTF